MLVIRLGILKRVGFLTYILLNMFRGNFCFRSQITALRHVQRHQLRSTATGFSNLEQSVVLCEEDWRKEAVAHSMALDSLLYPSSSAKSRFQPKRKQALHKPSVKTHLVSDNPIYNFLHSYYKYSTADLKKYSPGMSVTMAGALPSAYSEILNEKFMTFSEIGGCYNASQFRQLAGGKYSLERITRDRDVLRSTSTKVPFFGCFGLHEWAMLYSGNGSATSRHQESTPLRVDQQTIDAVVGVPGQLRCTHYDAFRFFQPAAKPINAVKTLSRENTPRHEQPGCIHANMDLFRYAYQLYPFVSSALLVQTLTLALEARKIDMRASPYDVSAFEGCEVPICVETPQGRKLYIEEQERVAAAAVPIRKALLDIYDEVLIRCGSE